MTRYTVHAPLWAVLLGGLLLLPLVAAVGCLALVVAGVDRLSRSSHWPIFLVMAVLLALVVIGAANYER